MSEQIRCTQCKHYDRVSGLQVKGRCLMTNIVFPSLDPLDVGPNPETFFCYFAEKRPQRYYAPPAKYDQATTLKKICPECSLIFRAQDSTTPCPHCGAVQRGHFSEVKHEA